MNNEEGQAAGPSNEFIELEPGSEWRFELEPDENIAVRVSRYIRFLCLGNLEKRLVRESTEANNICEFPGLRKRWDEADSLSFRYVSHIYTTLLAACSPGIALLLLSRML